MVSRGRNPDAALMGYYQGRKAIVLLSIGEPLLVGRIARFKAYQLTPDDEPLLQDGPVGALMDDYRLVSPPPLPLARAFQDTTPPNLYARSRSRMCPPPAHAVHTRARARAGARAWK
jgi:hypothetical protein